VEHLKPRETVVNQESSYAPEQAEEPAHALVVPENMVREAVESLNRLAADKRSAEDDDEGNNGNLGNNGNDLKAATAVQGTACHYTGRRPSRDITCGDLLE
jgi:hypothetical protein